MNTVKVYSPATIANLGSGFDLLGLAVAAPGDIVTATRTPEKKLTFILETKTANLPEDHRNVTYHVAQKIYDILRPDTGVEIRLQKNIPASSGMGGSAASSAAAACAMNWLFDAPFSREELLPFAIAGELLASGSPHADNVAPALFGGLCLLSPGDKTEAIQLPVNKKFHWILVHPELECDTRQMRALLPKTLSLTTHTRQSGLLATLLTGLWLENDAWVGRGMSDLIAEPARSACIPGFSEVRAAALTKGALGFGISGSGPALFALTDSFDAAVEIADCMQKAFLTEAGLESRQYISPVNTEGTVLLDK